MDMFDLLIQEESCSLPGSDCNAYEHYVLRVLFLAYVNAHKNNKALRFLNSDFTDWYKSHADQFQLNIPQFDRLAQGIDIKDVNVDQLMVPYSVIVSNKRDAPALSPLQRRLDWVCETLGLDTLCSLVLSIIFRLTRVSAFRSFARLIKDGCYRDEVARDTVTQLLGITRQEADGCFGDSSPLLRMGLLEDRHGGDFSVSTMLVDLLRKNTDDTEVLKRCLFGQLRTSQLGWSDFAHLGDAVGDVLDILTGAFARQEKGINIIFHGDPGTGKTEFATLLGGLCNAHVVFAGEMDGKEKEPDRSDRLTHLSFLSALGQQVGRTIVVVDEADDVFVGTDSGKGSDRQGSKVFLNRLVETSPVPTVWITNHPHRLGEAVLRRMVRAVEFRKPGITVRRRMIDRHAADLNVSLDPLDRDRLARLPVAPAVIASALRAASLCERETDGCTGEMAVASAMSIHRAMTRCTVGLAMPRERGFDASLSSADADLVALEERVVAAGPGALSFLFTGLPGTGKSAFARHLAERLSMEVLEKRGSDLLGMYVGQTEANIAEAFQEARDNGMFLIFDEADSLLSDRRGAVRTWEVSQVNEMLTWMERHPLPFAATSNLLEKLDPAVQRRFLFKARFDAMSKTQVARAFDMYFGCKAPAGVLKLAALTPGDFVVVARKAKVLQVTDPGAIGEMLKAEVALKPGARQPIGFV